jgi:hypothetical protein
MEALYILLHTQLLLASVLYVADLVMRRLHLPEAKLPFISGFPVCSAFMTI